MRRWLRPPTIIVATVSAATIAALAMWGLHQRRMVKAHVDNKKSSCQIYEGNLRSLKSTFLAQRKLRADIPAKHRRPMPMPLSLSAQLRDCVPDAERGKREIQLARANERLISDDIEGAAKLWTKVANAIRAANRD